VQELLGDELSNEKLARVKGQLYILNVLGHRPMEVEAEIQLAEQGAGHAPTSSWN
jgi:hypothetical protein